MAADATRPVRPIRGGARLSPPSFIKWLREIRLADVALVRKTASLGELYGELGAAGVRVPDGFAVTAEAYRALLDGNGLRDRLAAILKGVTGEDVTAVAVAGAELRGLVESAPLAPGLEDEIIAAYRALGRELSGPSSSRIPLPPPRSMRPSQRGLARKWARRFCAQHALLWSVFPRQRGNAVPLPLNGEAIYAVFGLS